MLNSDAVIELQGLIQQDDGAAWVSNLWDTWDHQRAEIKNLWHEIDEYIYSTDTTTTSNRMNPWTHTARNPKLTQIRDNLHSNYLSSLFPNDKWLTWQAFSADAAKKEVKDTLTAYMTNKTREGGFRDTVSQLLYDYIDRGNAFAMPTFEARYKVTEMEKVTDFIGPTAVRIRPEDIVFNPTVARFDNSPKIIRSMVTLGQLKKLAETHPDHAFWQKVIERRQIIRSSAQTYSIDDWHKAQSYTIAGFGNLQEYYLSDTVEILEFYGDYHNAGTGELQTGRMITVVDRSFVARNINIPTYSGKAPIYQVGWRKRNANLWAQGPLENLVGMQYQIDHYMNMAANALDLKVMPPIKIIGDVNPFNWQPRAEIHIDENGDVQEMAQGFGDIASCLEFIAQLENRMEQYAGAPREAMGIRTPGEKTAFEVQALENAAGRIFNEKVIQFEIFMEQLLNGMLEVAHRNMNVIDVIRVIDDDLGVEQFIDIQKEDITADGVLRPVGARHFAQRAQELQNLVGVFNSPIGQMVAPHTSGIALAEFVKDVVNLRGYDIFQPNIAVSEQQKLQALAAQAEEDNMRVGMINPDEIEMQLAEEGAFDEDQPTQ